MVGRKGFVRAADVLGAGMDCASLERYLEAYLEGRLRRAQWLVLRRHVITCPHCRARVEELRQFEVDLHQRFRVMGRSQRLWTGLELDLVGLPSAAASGDLLPPKAPRPPLSSLSGALLLPPARSNRPLPAAPQDLPVREPRWPAVALLCLVLAGIGTGGWLLVRPAAVPAGDLSADLRFLAGAEDVEPAAEAVAASTQNATPMAASAAGPQGNPLALKVDIPAAEVPAWLESRLGQKVDLALPPDLDLMGGSTLQLGPVRHPAVVASGRDVGRLLILPTVNGMRSISADVGAFARRHGLAHMIRRHDGATFDVVGAVSSEKLDALFFASASLD
jgi:hypothetical protein